MKFAYVGIALLLSTAPLASLAAASIGETPVYVTVGKRPVRVGDISALDHAFGRRGFSTPGPMPAKNGDILLAFSNKRGTFVVRGRLNEEMTIFTAISLFQVDDKNNISHEVSGYALEHTLETLEEPGNKEFQ